MDEKAALSIHVPQLTWSLKFDTSAWMRNIRVKEKQKMCQNAFFLCLQGIRMRTSRSTEEEQNMDV